jgi:hypothetical protein
MSVHASRKPLESATTTWRDPAHRTLLATKPPTSGNSKKPMTWGLLSKKDTR